MIFWAVDFCYKAISNYVRYIKGIIVVLQLMEVCMKAMTRVGIFLFGAVVSLALAGCATEQSQVKRDYRNAAAGKNVNESGFDEEYNEFDESRADNKYSDKKQQKIKKDAEDEEADSSFKKDKYYETGPASWYGREFHGKKTASGEKFDMNGLTAAHKSLPFGTLVSVKNFDNGKTVTVRINDRGPYKGNRIMDLSYGAAKKIGMIKNGKSNVGIKILKKGSAPDEDDQGKYRNIEAVSDAEADEKSDSGGGYTIQAGAFYSKRNAENLKTKIEGLTDSSVVIVHSNDMYKVRVLGMQSKQDAARFKKTLASENIPAYMVSGKE
jgi:rare lipoprotein A